MPINRTIWRLARLVEWLQKKASTPLRDRFSVGRGTYGEPAVLSWGGPSTLRVGSFCSIAEGVVIFLGGGNHRHDWITTYPFSVFRESAKAIAGQMQTKGDVIIGNDVWIGASAVILSGVSIGDGAVIGAYAVVSKSVPAYTVAVGNPARPVRKRSLFSSRSPGGTGLTKSWMPQCPFSYRERSQNSPHSPQAMRKWLDPPQSELSFPFGNLLCDFHSFAASRANPRGPCPRQTLKTPSGTGHDGPGGRSASSSSLLARV